MNVYMENLIKNYNISTNTIMDLSILQDFQIQTSDSWNNWQFTHHHYADFPLAFFSRLDRVGKYCDLSQASSRAQDMEFITVQGNTKQKNKQFIPKDTSTVKQRRNNYYPSKVLTKKHKKNWRPYINQNKTKFKEITVKNDWKIIKNINKNFLENMSEPKVKVTQLNTRGKLRTLNPTVERISWVKRQFKQNQEYQIQPIDTMKDSTLKSKILQIINSEDEQVKAKKTLVCSIEFLLAIMTAKGGQFPWNIMISKLGNLITMGNYHDTTETDKFSYIDLFTENENTNNNMPKEEAKLKQNCINATKLSKVFKDLLASGDFLEEEQQDEEEEEQNNNQKNKNKGKQQLEQNEQQEQEQQQEEQEEQEEEEPQHLLKYIKIELDDIDIYTRVTVDGLKKKSDGTYQPCLIRTFVETQTDGAWIQDITTSTGKITTQEYQANTCNLQKWVCQAKLAGVELIKTGYIGYTKREPFILNVNEVTVTSWQKFLSFKITDCWPILNRILSLIFSSNDGEFVLSRNAYFPLSIKLYQLPDKDNHEEEDEGDENKE